MRKHQVLKKQGYTKFTHAQRIDLIYEHIVHGVSMRSLAGSRRINYNTIRKIILAYKCSGRTNKKNARSIQI